MDALNRALDSALNNVKEMRGEEILNQIAACSIREYGLYQGLLAERMQTALMVSMEESKIPGVVCALNNADTEGVLLEVLTKHPEKVMEGISIAAYALKTDRKILHLPEYAENLAESVSGTASKYQVKVVTGIVDVRASRADVLIHIITACNLADHFSGEADDRFYLSVNQTSLQRVPGERKISELEDCTGAKAILLGDRFYHPEAAELTVSEAQIPNAVLTVLTSNDCMISEVQRRLEAYRRQSCGTCVFCREGLIQLYEMQKDMMEGKGKNEFIEIIKEIAEAMEFSSACTLGQSAAALVLTAVKLFEPEYQEHIKKKRCSAGSCFTTEKIYIDPKLCSGCGDCMEVCPKDCIEGKVNYIHMIDELDCIQCGKCIGICEEKAVMKTSGKVPKLPDRLTKAGRFRGR